MMLADISLSQPFLRTSTHSDDKAKIKELKKELAALK